MKKIIIIIVMILISNQLFSQGNRWDITPIPFTGNNQSIGNASFVNGDIGYVNNFYSADNFNTLSIYKTTDKGLNWSFIANCGSSIISHRRPIIHFINENTGFIATILGSTTLKIGKTTNGGNNWVWTDISIFYPEMDYNFPWITKFSFASDETGYISTGYQIFKTTNGGQNWNSVINSIEFNTNQKFIIKDIDI